MFKIDSGSPISAVSFEYYRKSKEFIDLKMSKSFRIFRTYSGGTIIPKETLQVNVKYKNENFVLTLYVLPDNNVPIIARDWLI